MRKRFKFSCWSCSEIFELTLELKDESRYSKECGRCGVRCTIELKPDRSGRTPAMRTTQSEQEIDLEWETINFPEVINTQEPDLEPAPESDTDD